MNLKTLHKLFFNHPEGRWIMDARNSHMLYNLIKKHPVKKILDLGTGIGYSASVISLALQDKKETDYEIHSIEQHKKCLDLAEQLIPTEFKDKIKFYHSKAIAWQSDQMPYQYLSTYESLPEGDWDLILNDGPGPFAEGDNYIDLSNGTIIKMLLENKLKPKTLITFDGRIKSLKIMERYFGDNFYILEPNKDFNVLERKDNEVSFRDLDKEMMEELGYFKP